MTPDQHAHDRRAPMSVGFWIGHGPRKVIIPFTFAVIVTVGTMLYKSFQLYGEQQRLAATMDIRSSERDKQIAALQADVTSLKDDLQTIRETAITRADLLLINAQLTEIRSVLMRGRDR